MFTSGDEIPSSNATSAQLAERFLFSGAHSALDMYVLGNARSKKAIVKLIGPLAVFNEHPDSTFMHTALLALPASDDESLDDAKVRVTDYMGALVADLSQVVLGNDLPQDRLETTVTFFDTVRDLHDKGHYFGLYTNLGAVS